MVFPPNFPPREMSWFQSLTIGEDEGNVLKNICKDVQYVFLMKHDYHDRIC